MIQLDVGQTEEQQRSQQVAVNARHSRSSRLLPHPVHRYYIAIIV